MLSLSHTIISLPFSVAFTNPFIIFFGAFLMHFIADMFLHWNIYPHHFKRYPFFLVGLDIASGIVASYLILTDSFFTIPVLAAIAGGNMPDVFHGLWSFMTREQQKRTPRFVQSAFAFHENIQWETESPLSGGLSQVILCSLAIYLTRFYL